jgi:hypothetical protein
MTTLDEMEDESLERELFALRAVTIETPRLDVEDVLARAERPWRAPHRASRVAACASMIACAAASYLALAPSQPHGSETSTASATMSYFDGLSCRNDMPDVVTSNDPTKNDENLCVARAQLVCDVTLESSRP